MKSSVAKFIGTDRHPVDINILTEVLAASSDACWCMEFGVPVDLSAPDQEIIRQFFENDVFWRLSNPAMAQLYLLPAGENFNDRPVREIFPRNKQNEDFVLNLLANGFEIDRAPALDTRYDGVQIYVENDVRAHVKNGQLIRMFGIVRDVGKHKHREAVLQNQLDDSLLILNSVTTPIFTVSSNGGIVLANHAAERLVSASKGMLLGQTLSHIISQNFDASFTEKFIPALEAGLKAETPQTTSVIQKNGNFIWQLTSTASSDSVTLVVTVIPNKVEASQ